MAALALIVIAVFWGYNWVVMKVGLRYSQPFTFSALRWGLGALTLIILLPILRRPLRPKALGLTALLGFLQTTGFTGLAMWALVTEGAGKTAILSFTMPFWLLLMARVFLGERLGRFQWVSVVLAFVGLILILQPWRLNVGFGTVLAIGGAISWSAGTVIAKVLQTRHKVDLLSMTAWQGLLGSIPLVLVAFLTWEGPPIWSGSFIAAVAFNAIPATALAYILWFFVVKKLSTGTAGIGSLLTPVIGIAGASIQLGERPAVVEALGMAAIVGALILLTVRGILAGRKVSTSKAARVQQSTTVVPTDRGLSSEE